MLEATYRVGRPIGAIKFTISGGGYNETITLGRYSQDEPCPGNLEKIITLSTNVTYTVTVNDVDGSPSCLYGACTNNYNGDTTVTYWWQLAIRPVYDSEYPCLTRYLDIKKASTIQGLSYYANITRPEINIQEQVFNNARDGGPYTFEIR